MKILITGLVPRTGLKDLEKHFEIIYPPEGTEFTREESLKLIVDCDGVVLMGVRADKEFIDAGKKLKIIAVNGVGFDNVDIAYAKEHGIAVANAPAAVMEPTAEMTMSLMLAITRRIGNYDRSLRNGVWQNINQPSQMGFSLFGATLGVFGIGRIGRSVAKRAKAFGMNIIYYEPRYGLSAEQESELEATRVSFEDLLSKSDVITIHAPLTSETRHLFGEKELKQMKSTSYLINAARGPIVDEQALIAALKSGEIAGAGLDVFENEPTIPDEMKSLENIVMTPHAGTACLSSRTILAKEAAGNIIAYLIDKTEKNIINK